MTVFSVKSFDRSQGKMSVCVCVGPWQKKEAKMKDGINAIAPDVKLGKDVLIYNFVNLYGCEIGYYSKIGTFVEIQKGAKIGKDCKVSSHTFICECVTIEDDVFISHNVTFINDIYPRATGADGGTVGAGS